MLRKLYACIGSLNATHIIEHTIAIVLATIVLGVGSLIISHLMSQTIQIARIAMMRG